MKKFKIIFIIIIATLFFYSCKTMKKGFESQRKNSTDEFLVEKKQPLTMPPDFDELPMPKQNQSNDQQETTNQIEELIVRDNPKDDSLNKNDSSNQNTENFILDKIKK
tara:strand:- start:189 stop:512 length:324 start_codon:yes stop_codon:yes gene_type:complete